MRFGSNCHVFGFLAAVGVTSSVIAATSAQEALDARFDDIRAALLHRIELLQNRPTDFDMAVVTPSGEWRSLIDARWGDGLPTAQKLAIFDGFWTVDRSGSAQLG